MRLLKDGLDADGKPAFGKMFPKNDRKQKADGGQMSGRQKEERPQTTVCHLLTKNLPTTKFQRSCQEVAKVSVESFRKNISLFDELSVQSHLTAEELLCALTELAVGTCVGALGQ